MQSLLNRPLSRQISPPPRAGTLPRHRRRKKFGEPSRQPKFTEAAAKMRRAAAQAILTNCDTCSSFIMKLLNSLFGRKTCCNLVKPPARLHVKSATCFETHTPCLGCQRAALLRGILRPENSTYTYWRRAARVSRGSKMELFTEPSEDLCWR